jgi:ubiquinone/menaquinone biosynthesis C-methylase UbiE
MPASLTQLERLRRAELEFVSEWFEPGDRVLELGAGSGYQASLLAAHGCHVTALDVRDRPRHERMHHPVQEYDGRTIPMPDESFDVVFSSHVLEHVSPLGPLLEETRRVMKTTGLAVHILPSSTWRAWTSLAHYPYVVKTLIFGPAADSLVDVGSSRDAIRRHGALRAAYRTLIHPFVAHGSSRNAFAEVAGFHERRWRTIFGRNGFTVVTAPPTKIFYTGYGVLGRMPLQQRRRISSVLGSSSRSFVLRKA